MFGQRRCSILMACLLVVTVICTSEITNMSRVDVKAQNVENATANQSGNTSNAQSNQSSESAPPLTNLIIDHAGGSFASLQTDNDNKTWIATGSWDLVSDPSNTNQSNSSVVNFNATVNMRGTDNSAGHEHKISDFKLLNSSIRSSEDGSEITYNGTGSMETDVGLYSDVPISIKIFDEGPAIVSIDTQTNEISPQWVPKGGTIGVLVDKRVEDHFGSTPVYGNVKGE